MNKIALNALKLRELAKELKIIAHPQSQWKWAIRDIRRNAIPRTENPILVAQSGKFGRQISEAKQGLGKLTNNELQALVAKQRKQKLGVESALTEKGLVYSQTDLGRHFERAGFSASEDTMQADAIRSKFSKGIIMGYDIKAHTHPAGERILHAVIPTKENKRVLDPILRAAPSGRDYSYSPRKRSRIISNIKRMVQEGFAPNKMLEDFTTKTIPKPSGDLKAGRQVILANNVQGVHKFSPKHEMASRSVYFMEKFNI